MTPTPPNLFVFEFDDPDEHPHNTRRPIEVLEYASAYLRLVQKLAGARKVELSFQSIKIVDECIQVHTVVSDPHEATRAAKAANDAIKNPNIPIPAGARALRQTCRKVATQFVRPAIVSVGTWSESVDWEVKDDEGQPWGTYSFRATLIGVTTQPPSVSLKPIRGDRDVSAKVVSAKNALAYAVLLEREVAVEVYSARDSKGRIERAEIRSLEAVDDEDASLADWTAWFESATVDGWADGMSTERALGRRDTEQ